MNVNVLCFTICHPYLGKEDRTNTKLKNTEQEPGITYKLTDN